MAPAIAHGGGLIAARQRFPQAPEPWLDLSTGINPVAYTLQVPPEAFARLPEPEAVAALEALAARAYGVADPAWVVAAPGTQSLIHLLPRLLPRRRVAVLAPTYAEHAAAWAQGGSAVRHVASLTEAAGADIVVVGNPNNPDGARPDRSTLLELAADLALRRGLLVVDEAFADFEHCSLAPVLPHAGLLLLRSFGKTYGLAGVRLGFAVADAATVGMLRTALGPWAVSGPALWAGQAALPDAAWRQHAEARLARDAARLDQLLQAAGCTIVGGTKLFRLATCPAAAARHRLLGAAGILVRDFGGQPDWLRFGLPPDDGWPRLERALAGAVHPQHNAVPQVEGERAQPGNAPHLTSPAACD